MRLLLLLLIQYLSGCATVPTVVPPEPDLGPGGPGREVFVAGHGWHTGVIVRADDLGALLPELGDHFPDAVWLELGWGDAGFYQAGKISIPLAMRAILWPTKTVVHVTGFQSAPARYFASSDVRRLEVSGGEYRSLLRFLASSFAVGGEGAIRPGGQGLYGDSRFYGGAGRYFFFNTCNKWTAKAMASGGVDISPTFKLTTASVLRAAPRRAGSSPIPEPSNP